ncbi:hypothetical protein GJ496_006899 [Pomphorhynchus laevis]|nr:hypothetical protein GJ496_006899 [Pomphorhynchus laevis]
MISKPSVSSPHTGDCQEHKIKSSFGKEYIQAKLKANSDLKYFVPTNPLESLGIGSFDDYNSKSSISTSVADQAELLEEEANTSFFRRLANKFPKEGASRNIILIGAGSFASLTVSREENNLAKSLGDGDPYRQVFRREQFSCAISDHGRIVLLESTGIMDIDSYAANSSGSCIHWQIRFKSFIVDIPDLNDEGKLSLLINLI